ncbi:MAG: hypothetical protein LDL31_09085, partial [Prosthecobacter sp.]|nr:hypothetical protein [Prosthecobacter sp.]
MKNSVLLHLSFLLIPLSLSAETSLTLYNQNFAFVRDRLTLDLKKGVNEVRQDDTTAHLEPDSVLLRDPKGAIKLTVLEQNYRADPLSQALLLSQHEGKEIDFYIKEPNKPDRVVRGKIIRSGYVPHNPAAMQRYGQAYYQNQMAYSGFANVGTGGAGQPIIEVDGMLQFSLPGEPRFPALAGDAILKPSLEWRIHSDQDTKLDAELCYVTGGMRWESTYNAISPEKGDEITLIGWVTMDNQSGKTFMDTAIQLIAGDVAKLSPNDPRAAMAFGNAEFASRRWEDQQPKVTEKAFDDFHLYTLPQTVTLRDRETKQVEFVRVEKVKSTRFYVYDGVSIDPNRYRGWNLENIRREESYGTESNPKVWIMREIPNKEANKLGIPLPKGRLRLYREDSQGRPHFVGEDLIDHTAREETLRLRTGSAFDLVGERKR